MTIRGWHLLFLVTIGASAFAWYQRNELHAERIDHANTLAKMDTLRMIQGEERDLWAQRSFVLTEALREELLERSALAREVDRLGFRLRSLSEVDVEAEGTVEDEAVVTVEEDSAATRLAVDWSDSLLTLRGSLRFPGTIQPDPTPPTSIELDYSVQLALEIAQVCDEDGLPQVLLSSPDPAVRVMAVKTVVDRAVSCIGQRTGLGSLNVFPRLEPATGIVGAIGVGIGYLLAR